MKEQDDRRPRLLVVDDGWIYLRREGSALMLPLASDEFPFEIRALRSIPGLPVPVKYAQADIQVRDRSWIRRDDAVFRDDLAPLVRACLDRILVRHVADAFVVRCDEVLVVRARHGLLAGRWDLPGGFIHFGEHPREGVVREVEEETGLRVRPRSLVHVESTVSDALGYDLLGFFYECEVLGGELNADPREITEIEWVSWRVASERITDPFLRPAMSIGLRSAEGGPSPERAERAEAPTH